MVRLILSEFFEYVRTELSKADREARAAYDAVIASKGFKRTKEQEAADANEAFTAARMVQHAAHQRLWIMLMEHYLELEE